MRMFGQQDPETFRSGIFEYVMLDDETVEITGIDVDGISVLWIPAMLDGFPVTSVGEGACGYLREEPRENLCFDLAGFVNLELGG